MANLDIVQDSYNKFENYPYIGYNIAKYLMENNEDIWKILKYSTPGAWKGMNLTSQEKAALIYAGQENETDYRLFFSQGQDNSWTVEACFLRIFTVRLVPETHVYGYVTVGFEVYCHYKNEMMDNYTTKIDYVTQQLIATLNGAEVEGIGRLYFDYRASSDAKSLIIGAIPYKGRATIMCNYSLG